jgi:hypothetical protein
MVHIFYYEDSSDEAVIAKVFSIDGFLTETLTYEKLKSMMKEGWLLQFLT